MPEEGNARNQLFRRQIYACTSFERRNFAATVRQAGADNIIFGTGFPHTSEEVRRPIPGSRLVEPPWGDREWIERMQDAQGGLFRRYPLLAPQILEFAATDAKPA